MLIGVDLGHFSRKLDPCQVELIDKFGWLEAVDCVIGWRMILRFTDTTFHGIWRAGSEVIDSGSSGCVIGIAACILMRMA